MDVALENAQNGLPKVQRRMFSCEISQAKGQSGKNVDQRRALLIPFFHEFRFFRARTFVGSGFFLCLHG